MSRLWGISWSPSAASLPELPEIRCWVQTCAGSMPPSPPGPTNYSPRHLSKWPSPTNRGGNHTVTGILELSVTHSQNFMTICPKIKLLSAGMMKLGPQIGVCSETSVWLLILPAVWSSAPPRLTWSGGGWSLRSRWLSASRNEGLCTTELLQSSQSEKTDRNRF